MSPRARQQESAQQGTIETTPELDSNKPPDKHQEELKIAPEKAQRKRNRKHNGQLKRERLERAQAQQTAVSPEHHQLAVEVADAAKKVAKELMAERERKRNERVVLNTRAQLEPNGNSAVGVGREDNLRRSTEEGQISTNAVQNQFAVETAAAAKITLKSLVAERERKQNKRMRKHMTQPEGNLASDVGSEQELRIDTEEEDRQRLLPPHRSDSLPAGGTKERDGVFFIRLAWAVLIICWLWTLLILWYTLLLREKL